MLSTGQTRVELQLDHLLRRRVDSDASGQLLDDQTIDQTIGVFLRIGVTASAFIVALGAILYLIHHGTMVPHYHTFRGEPADLTSIRALIGDALRFDPLCLIQLGLLVLIMTPVVRVAFALLAFAIQRDLLYVAVSLIVLAVLVYSIASGS